MSLLDEKLINVIDQSSPAAENFFDGSIIVEKWSINSSYTIQVNEKNNGFLLPERAMSILSFRDLLDIPGKDYAVPENNPISDGISKFCEAFKEVHQEDFEQFGKDVLLEGLKSNQYSMTFDSDPFRLYLLQKDKVFRTDLGKKGLRLTYNFLKSYGRLPFPEERLDKPDTVVLFKEKIEVPVGVLFQIPGAAPSEKILVTINPVNKTFFTSPQIFYMDNRYSANFNVQDPRNWIFNVSIKDVPACILSKLSNNLLSILASVDKEIFCGKNLKIFSDAFKKKYPVESTVLIIKMNDRKTIRFSVKGLPDTGYKKGMIPFILATGRLPEIREILDYDKTNACSLEQVRQ